MNYENFIIQHLLLTNQFRFIISYFLLLKYNFLILIDLQLINFYYLNSKINPYTFIIIYLTVSLNFYYLLTKSKKILWISKVSLIKLYSIFTIKVSYFLKHLLKDLLYSKVISNLLYFHILYYIILYPLVYFKIYFLVYYQNLFVFNLVVI